MAYVPIEQRRERAARRQENRIRQRERFAADPTIAEHGKPSTYTNYGCRCDLCTVAGVAAVQDYRARLNARKAPRQQIEERYARLAADPSAFEHGKPWTYFRYGCRCDPCRDAGAGAMREYRARKARRRSTELEK